MKKLISYEFDIDIAYIELRFTDPMSTPAAC